MNGKRLLSALLLILLPTASILTSCGSKTDLPASVTASANTEAEVTTPAETELQPNLPDTNWEGREFTFFTRGSDYGDWECQDIYAEAENGEPINDAVYRRNLTVSDRYNLVISEIKGPTDMHKTLYNSVMAGESVYDAAMMRGAHISYNAENSNLLNLKKLSYVDLSMPWWDPNAQNDFSIGGRLFFTCSAIGISDKDGTWLMVFNKRLLDAYALESPYAMVDANRWYLDPVYEMVRKVSADLDGDGKMTATDQWGMAAEGFDTYAQFIGCGERIFRNNADGYPELTVFNERAVSVIDKYMSMVADTANYTTEVTVRTYNQGNAFLMATTMMTIRLFFRTMDDDFGMVPVPKYDENQENYREVVSCGTSGAMIGVPITTKDPEFAGFVLEALSAESYKVLIPAYYDICFSTKYLRDEESVDMLDLVFANRVFEPSILYDWGGWYSYFSGLSATSKVDLASTYASKMDQTNAAIEKTVAAYDAVE